MLTEVDFDRGAFACALGRGGDPLLYVVGQNWGTPGGAPSGRLASFPSPAPGAGHP